MEEQADPVRIYRSKEEDEKGRAGRGGGEQKPFIHQELRAKARRAAQTVMISFSLWARCWSILPM
jgi:hypothetical protein